MISSISEWFYFVFLFNLTTPGLFYTDEMAMFQTSDASPAADLINWILGLIPSYKDLLAVVEY